MVRDLEMLQAMMSKDVFSGRGKIKVMGFDIFSILRGGHGGHGLVHSEGNLCFFIRFFPTTVHSGASTQSWYFVVYFLTCPTVRWADTAATVQPRDFRKKTKHVDWVDAPECTDSRFNSHLFYRDTFPHCIPPPLQRPRGKRRHCTFSTPPGTPETSSWDPLRTSGSRRSTGTTGSTRGTASHCMTWIKSEDVDHVREVPRILIFWI